MTVDGEPAIRQQNFVGDGHNTGPGSDRADGSSVSGAAELAALVEHRIVAGQLRPGEKLEPVRSLAARLGLAPNTVASAYRLLARRGLVEGRGRAGTVVTGQSMPSRFLLESLPDGLIDLATGNPDPSLLPDHGVALARLIADGRIAPVGYGEALVTPALGAALERRWGDDPVGEGGFVAVPGAMAAIAMALSAYLRPGDRVAVEDPGYRPVRALAAARGLSVVPVAIDASGARPDSLAAAVGSGVNAVVLTPRAQNPTGVAQDQARTDALAAVLADHPEVLVIDDDHANTVAGAPFHGVTPRRALTPGARWLLVRSVAKSLGPDLRLAAVTGDDRTTGLVARELATTVGWLPHLIQNLVAELLADEVVDGAVVRAAEAYRERRRVFAAELAAAGAGNRLLAPRSGFNCWVWVDDEAAIVSAMARAGFAVTAGARFRVQTGPGVRVSVGAQPIEVVADAARALGRLLVGDRVGRLG